MSFIEFLNSGWGIALFTVIAIAVILFVLAVWYRTFAKAVSDFLAALITTIVLSPCMAVCAIIVKVKTGKVLTRQYCMGKGGNVIYLHTFNYYEKEEGVPSYISGSSLARLPYLFGVLAGKLSIVGPAVVSVKDSCFIDDEQFARFDVRPGIINPAITKVKERPEYDELFELECGYAKKYGLFKDIVVVLYTLLCIVRGDNIDLSCRKISYSDELLEQGRITKEDIAEAEENETQSILDSGRAKYRINTNTNNQ
ncbi:MAG: sugar transferase [Clostridia bacterium]|nr:sugar transferase [Clostridia bacterium]